METVAIGLGSNLQHPKRQILSARDELHALPHTELIAFSRLYCSKPMGPADQPDYINAVALLDTALSPLTLLDHCQAIERAHGRKRGPQRWGPRTLDLDILLYGQACITEPRLQIPHPGLYQRAFVLYPLREIDPQRVFPDGETLAARIKQCDRSGLSVMSE